MLVNAGLTGQTPEQLIIPMALLAARVGQIVAMAAAEVPRTGRQVQLSDAPAARAAIDDQWTGEPPTPPAHGRRRRLEHNRHVDVDCLAVTSVDRVTEPQYHEIVVELAAVAGAGRPFTRDGVRPPEPARAGRLRND